MSDLIDRQAVHYYIQAHINEIITESGVDKNAHTNAILRALVKGVDTMPSVSVIEDIKAEIMALEPQYPIDDNTPYISSQSVWKIINKHCGGDNE